ncbi:MAG: endonuclease III [Thermoleophilia bacterium]|jgi:endonuclease III
MPVKGQQMRNDLRNKEMALVSSALRDVYKDFGHYNRKNPLEELVFILLSVMTTEKSYRNVYAAVRNDFPRFQMLADAPVHAIAKSIKNGGLSNQKAKAINRIFNILSEEFGKPTLSPLKNWSDENCEVFLTGLPGVGKKVARCVMLYSLKRETFPVDTHCWRICYRLGWTKEFARSKDMPTEKEMDQLQTIIPPKLRFSLHVNMVSLGRKICTANRPKCSQCPIKEYCEQRFYCNLVY